MGNSQKPLVFMGTVLLFVLAFTLYHRRSSDQQNPSQPLRVSSGSESLTVDLGPKSNGGAGGAQKLPEDELPADELPAPKILSDLRGNSAVGLSGVNVAALTQDQKRLTVHSVLDNTDTVCERKLRMGNLGDGGWEICDDRDVRPYRPCTVYSFGISGDFSFDDDTASTYGCHLFSFDPSMKEETHNRSEFVHFYKIGIAGQTTQTKSGWKLYTLTDVRKLLGHQNTRIDVLKIDVENSEWGALKEMSRSGELQRIKQLLVEFHLGLGPPNFALWLDVLQMLEREGFRKFYVHKNPAKPCEKKVQGYPGLKTVCYEIHYVRRPP